MNAYIWEKKIDEEFFSPNIHALFLISESDNQFSIDIINQPKNCFLLARIFRSIFFEFSSKIAEQIIIKCF